MSKQKKSEIHNRAKRLLGAFTTEARKQSHGQKRKLIRAQYEKGLLVFKEDFVTVSYAHSPPPITPGASTKVADILFSKIPVPPQPTTPANTAETAGQEKLRLVLGEIVQMYSLQFKIVDELLGILKSELQKF